MKNIILKRIHGFVAPAASFPYCCYTAFQLRPISGLDPGLSATDFHKNITVVLCYLERTFQVTELLFIGCITSF